jgi:hypothetical protein
MKTYTFTPIFFIVLVSISARADVKFEFLFRHQALEKEFKYQLSVPEHDYEIAFEKASLECFHHFKNKKHTISNEETMDLIDTCANPVVNTIK